MLFTSGGKVVIFDEEFWALERRKEFRRRAKLNAVSNMPSESEEGF